MLIICICPKIVVSQATFTDVTDAADVGNTDASADIAWGNYDNDWDIDLYLVNYREPNVLYRNNGNSNHWIVIKTVQTFLKILQPIKY